MIEDDARNPSDAEESPRDSLDGDDLTDVGFTWGEIEEIVWIRNDDGDYKRIDRPFLATLRDLAAGERTPADLSAKESEAVDQLFTEGHLEPGRPVTKRPTPDDIALWPRVSAFVVAFGLLTAYVVYRVFLSETAVPTVGTMGLGVFEQLLLSVPLFVVLAVVHEAGHYLAARPYFETSIEFTRLNGVFPAIATQTNDAWRCPRSVRIWINLAGPLADSLQCLALAAASLFLFPNSYLLAVVPVFEYFRIVFSLNPLVRGDGYWMIVDWFGATNLYSRGISDLKNADVTVGSLYALTSVAFTLVGAGMMAYFVATLAGIV